MFKQACKIVLVGIFPALMFYFSVVKLHHEEKTVRTPPVYPYHTIYFGDNNMLGYILNKDEERENYPCYSAVIKETDPSKDDYKACCKAVISDVVHTADSDEIAVYVFDSFEAYNLYTSYSQQMQALTPEQFSYIDKHIVATYYGELNRYNAPEHILYYYHDAGNGHSEEEHFMPYRS